MKRILSIILSVILIFSVAPLGLFSITANAEATSGTCGKNLTWEYDTSTYTLTISGTGVINHYTDSPLGHGYPISVTNAPWRSFYSTMKNVIIKHGITAVGSSAFQGCVGIQSITVANSVTLIYNKAFYECRGLMDVYYSGTEEQRASIDIGNNNSYLTNATWHYNATTSIGDCGSNLTWEYDPFTLTLTISGTGKMSNYSCLPYDENDVTTAPWKIYYNTMKTVVINFGVTSIGNYAFRGCTGLTSVTIGNRVTLIDSCAFVACTGLTSITIPDSVTSIGSSAFSGCTGLKNINIPDSVTSILYGAFHNTAWYDNQADGLVYAGKMAYEYKGTCPASVTIKEGTVGISSYAFWGCTGLTSVRIPNGVTSIGDRAFLGCTGLTDVYYNGTEVERSNINIDNYNDYLKNAIWHYDTDWNFKFTGVSLTLQNNLSVNYYVNAELFDIYGYENPYVKFEMGDRKVTVSDYIIKDGCYVFTFSDIAPDRMNDRIKAKLYAEYNGEECSSEELEYSVATYCYSMLGKTDNESLKTLIVDLLNYGSASQQYTGHNSDNLANANLTAEQRLFGTVDDPDLWSVKSVNSAMSNPELEWKGVSLTLIDSITMQFVFTADDIDGVTIKIRKNSKVIAEIPAEEFESSGGYYIAKYKGLNATEMSDMVQVTAYRNNIAISNTLTYSIESYAYSKQNDSNENLANLVKCMMKYGNSASSYAN